MTATHTTAADVTAWTLAGRRIGTEGPHKILTPGQVRSRRFIGQGNERIMAQTAATVAQSSLVPDCVHAHVKLSDDAERFTALAFMDSGEILELAWVPTEEPNAEAAR